MRKSTPIPLASASCKKERKHAQDLNKKRRHESDEGTPPSKKPTTSLASATKETKEQPIAKLTDNSTPLPPASAACKKERKHAQDLNKKRRHESDDGTPPSKKPTSSLASTKETKEQPIAKLTDNSTPLPPASAACKKERKHAQDLNKKRQHGCEEGTPPAKKPTTSPASTKETKEQPIAKLNDNGTITVTLPEEHKSVLDGGKKVLLLVVYYHL